MGMNDGVTWGYSFEDERGETMSCDGYFLKREMMERAKELAGRTGKVVRYYKTRLCPRCGGHGLEQAGPAKNVRA